MLWCPKNFYSQHVLERRIVWCIKSRTHLFTNLSLISRSSKQLHQGVLYKAETWHALSQEQYFLKYHFLDISQCVFNFELAKNMIKPPLIWLIYLMYNFISCQWIDIITVFSSFDINCKIFTLMWKTPGIVFSGHLGGWVFHIFPRLHLIMWVCLGGWNPYCFLEVLWIMLQYSIQALCNI